ncbi:gliding motility-associated C-terminal domain-containing protein [Hymenobacter sp. ISL-91]|uniref:T9SS type B sorting domain-containing protein n=1 Tax=Hymenobacter sp. ISL-91 TaxID=2819151 RepID=UPI001BEAF294|nr:gliding motility-associated C-terminal domain-containing protein [Hymenobacter sp. ISL-91]MBT2559014.1 gliding motility-associated C-terminal domain-containing protein [Hymenobacter sp. ISL-91]
MPATLILLPVSHSLLPTKATRPIPACRYLNSRRQAAVGWLFTLLLLLTSGAAYAQVPTGPPECSEDEKFANTWYFGFKAGLDFNMATDSILPTVLTNGAMDAPAGAGVMSDGDGKILFYSNGETVWNGDGTVMTNGTGLLGSRLVTDGPLPIRMPGSPPPGSTGVATRYLLFTQDAAGGPNGLRYSEIIIPAGGGPGEVVTKNVLLTTGTAEKMTAVFHKNGCDIWLIVHGWGTATSGTANRGDAFLAYRVKPPTGGMGTGPVTIDPPILSTIGALHAPSPTNTQGYRGQMKITPDGQQLAVARFSEVALAGDSTGTVELFSFDKGSGTVSNRKAIDADQGGYYGVAFSPGRSRLYATVLGAAPRLPQLLQFDISTIGTGAGNGPVGREVIPLGQTTPVNLGSMQTAPDGKIYVAREDQPALGFISYPDSLGAAIGYADDSLQLGGRLSGLGLVNFNQSSLLRFGFSGQPTGCLEYTFEAPPVDFENPQYAWDFGDGTTSTAQNPPPHLYPRPGDYEVTLRITTECFCRESKSIVRIFGPPTPGTIAANQAVCAGDTPALLTSATPAAEGTGQYSYQWQQSTNNVTFTDITGATGETYQPPVLNVTTYYKRLVSSGFCPPLTTSNTVAITVTPAVVPGTIAADQTVCVGSAPAPLTSTAAPTGGTGSFAFQWESSLDNAIWTAVANGTGETYAPGPLTVTTFFRRQVSSGPCDSIASNVVTITVTPALTAGTIAADQTVCTGAAPDLLTSPTAATGGNGPITYQWESSADNATWTPIPGATNATYQPVALTATTYFRRRASSGAGCAPAISNVVTITVAPAVVAGTIAADQTLCQGATPAPLTSTGDATGGLGAVTYQWEISTNNTTWTPVSGATSAGFAPGPITVTTYFRRQASTATCAPAPSNVVTLTVLPELLAGSIAADQDVCTGTAPAPLSSAGPASGGTGTFAYQWESSLNNSTWTAIGGATGPTYQPAALTATTFFRRRVTSGTGTCSTQVSNVVTIRVLPSVTPTVTVATPPASCPGTPLTFTAVATDAGATPAYQWFVNDIPVASGPTFTSSTVVTGDRVRVEVTASPGLCSTGPATATVTVTRTPTPTPTLVIAQEAGQAACAGEPQTFRATSVTNGGTNPAYQWQVDGNDVPGATNPVFTSSTLRDGQTVTLRLSTANSCGPATAVSNGVVVRVQPVVKISAGPDKEIILGNSVVLEGTADGTYPVTWAPAAGLDFSGNDPLRPRASPTTTTTYTLSAGTGGCAATDQVTVTVREAIRIPNAFTPNGDGRNDTWQIEFIEQFPDNTVTVFNRWGTQVFSAQNYSRANEWNGNINGKPAPVGTYYYVVVTKGPLGKSFSGSLTVLY